ncbi:hypothetical protein [Streptomyces sp. 7N604]|uniref:hypothetical protein n=1 Tax=Streptomyces sp. 7N604 TaxID=3457415 RepID=UPI003FD23018
MLDLFAMLLLLASSVLMLVSRRSPTPRRRVAAAVLLLPSALLYGLAHFYWVVGLVLLLAALHAGIAAGQYRAARRQPDAKPSQDSASRK